MGFFQALILKIEVDADGDFLSNGQF